MTAEDAYVHEYSGAQTLVVRVEEHLRNLPAPSDDFHPHWGHVGDLREVNRMLEAVLEFMRGEARTA